MHPETCSEACIAFSETIQLLTQIAQDPNSAAAPAAIEQIAVGLAGIRQGLDEAGSVPAAFEQAFADLSAACASLQAFVNVRRHLMRASALVAAHCK